jgi:hypothetical protein
LLIPAVRLHAQEALPANVTNAVDGMAGNNVIQFRYFTPSPISGMRGDLVYGALLTENREFVGTAALMFNTDLDIVPRLRLGIGPQGYLARLAAAQKTDVFAVAIGANARYELIRRLGIAAFGSAFYSPGVLTFGNAHNLYDFTAGAEVRLTPSLVAMGGYRWFKFTLVGEPDERVANEVFAGLSWRWK